MSNLENPEPVAPAAATEATPAPAPKPTEVKDESAALKAKLAEYEAKEREAEQAKLSEAERLKSERDELARERFQFDLQRAGIPESLAKRFGAVDGKGRAAAIAEIAAEWEAAVKAHTTPPAAPKATSPGNPIIPPAPTGTKQPANPYADIAKTMRARKP